MRGERGCGRELQLDRYRVRRWRVRPKGRASGHAGQTRLHRWRQCFGGRLRLPRRSQGLGDAADAFPSCELAFPPSDAAGRDRHAGGKGSCILHAPSCRAADADDVLNSLPWQQPVLRSAALDRHAVNHEAHCARRSGAGRSQAARRKPVSCASAQPRRTPRG